MVIQLAFKIAAKSGSPWSELIAKASGSNYSHVELFLDGPLNAARCFSSREPHGASFLTIDLTAPMWEIVPYPGIVSAIQEAAINAFCRGANGKEYDFSGLVGYKFGTGLHDDHDVYCSEVISECLSDCMPLALPKSPWMTSPGDLYALVKGQK